MGTLSAHLNRRSNTSRDIDLNGTSCHQLRSTPRRRLDAPKSYQRRRSAKLLPMPTPTTRPGPFVLGRMSLGRSTTMRAFLRRRRLCRGPMRPGQPQAGSLAAQQRGKSLSRRKTGDIERIPQQRSLVRTTRTTMRGKSSFGAVDSEAGPIRY